MCVRFTFHRPNTVAAALLYVIALFTAELFLEKKTNSSKGCILSGFDKFQ